MTQKQKAIEALEEFEIAFKASEESADLLTRMWVEKYPKTIRKALSSIPEWRPIETAPRDGTEFLATDFDREFRCTYVENKVVNAKNSHYLAVFVRKRRYSTAARFFEPSHWMPLPKPSEQEQKG